MLVRMRIAEIREHAVAHVLGNKTAVALDHFRATTMISADDYPQALGIEPSRQRRRAHQIAKHHRELTAFSGVVWFRFDLGGGLRRGRTAPATSAIAASILRRRPSKTPMSLRS
jgi:hypothetical protein